jgi:hypothetical protein
MKIGISFFIRKKCSKVNLNRASILSFLFHDMELLQKILQFLEKSFFSRFEHRKNGNSSQIEDKTPVEILLDNHFVCLKSVFVYGNV